MRGIFRRIWVRHKTGWHVTTRAAWLASVGDRAICPRPLLRAIPSVSRTLHCAPVGQGGPPGPDWLAISFGFWSGRALATGTAWAGLCLIHHHPIRFARLGSWLKARAKSSARVPKVATRVPKVARRRKRLRSWGAAGRAVTSPKCRPDDLPRPSSSHLSQIARLIALVPMGAAHRAPTTCRLHRAASSGHPVRVRLSAGWPEVEMAAMRAALPRSGT